MKDFFQLREANAQQKPMKLMESSSNNPHGSDYRYNASDDDATKHLHQVANRRDDHPKHNGHEGAYHEHMNHAEDMRAQGNHRAAAMHEAAAHAHTAASEHLDKVFHHGGKSASMTVNGRDHEDLTTYHGGEKGHAALEQAHHMAHAAAHFAQAAKDAGGNDSASRDVAKSHDVIKSNQEYHKYEHAAYKK